MQKACGASSYRGEAIPDAVAAGVDSMPCPTSLRANGGAIIAQALWSWEAKRPGGKHRLRKECGGEGHTWEDYKAALAKWAPKPGKDATPPGRSTLNAM